MNTYLISDTHLNHNNIETYCARPSNFTELIVKGWRRTVQKNDMVIHLGDVYIDKADGWEAIYPSLPGRKILIRGNHDMHHSCTWWMEHGFDFACDGLVFRHAWLTHKPAFRLPYGCQLNIHGHLHNIWHGFHRHVSAESEENRAFQRKKLNNDFQRLFALEYTNYLPVNFEKFISHPDKYQSRGPVPNPTANNL